ncbi:MAG TPA: CTP synthase, partial [Myxococcota bacterium]|nr:CTP synthase [Myxococcota bacterium]
PDDLTLIGSDGVSVDDVVAAPDVPNIYQLPMVLREEHLDDRVLQRLNIWAGQPHMEKWEEYVARAKNPHHRVRIAIVGKYVHLTDTYKSLNEALAHGGVANDAKVELVYVDSEELEAEKLGDVLGKVDAVLIPGGFGSRGTEGKILAIRYAREKGIPFFGICLGMQLAVVEYARHMLGLSDAHSSEFAPQGAVHLVHLMENQKDVTDKGGTMRLGAWPCVLAEGTKARQIYGTEKISERHRHRYEVNNAYRAELEKKGMRISGTSPDGTLVEMVELPNHPYFVACQFHPEFKSRPLAPHPLFSAFVHAAVEFRRKSA